MDRIGIYLGTFPDDTENIEKILLSWGKYLSSEFSIDVFGTAKLPESCTQYFNYVELTEKTYSTPFSKIKVSYSHTKKYIQRYEPDLIIQLWKFNTHASGVTCAGVRYNTPTIIRYSGATFESYQTHRGITRLGTYFLNNILNKNIALNLCDHVIVLGPNGKTAMTERGVDDEQITILPPTLDAEGRFHPPKNKSLLRRELGLPEDRQIALYVGRITKKKGMDFLEEVINKSDSQNEILFILVGEGNQRKRFEENFESQKVRTIGRVPYSEIDKYYKAADLYLHPSSLEGIPLVLLEAMECGLPIIAQRAGDISFISRNVVDSPKEMVSMIENETWDNEFLHKEYFSDKFQQERLTNILSKVMLESK